MNRESIVTNLTAVITSPVNVAPDSIAAPAAATFVVDQLSLSAPLSMPSSFVPSACYISAIDCAGDRYVAGHIGVFRSAELQFLLAA